jgi:type II secretory pathway pseudopilin PulG
LIELLVVIAIISLLITILMPSLSRAKRLTMRAICLSNERNLLQAAIAYSIEHEALPPVSLDDGQDGRTVVLCSHIAKWAPDGTLLFDIYPENVCWGDLLCHLEYTPRGSMPARRTTPWRAAWPRRSSTERPASATC